MILSMSDVKLFQGNCLELIGDVPDGSVDCIVTDPPYCVGATSNGRKGDFFDNNLIAPFFDLLFAQLKRVLKNDGAMYCHTDWRMYPFLFPILKKHLEVRNCIVWDYQWMKAGSFYRFQHEFIMFATNPGYKRKFGGGERDVWRMRCINYTNLKTKLHQSQKPVELAEKMIVDSTDPGDTVLDCFMGSGTTGVACVRNGRSFIGMELQEKYYEVARNRIDDEVWAVRDGVPF